MISAFRRVLDTWVARVFFGIMVIAFVTWGVGDVVRRIGTSSYIAKVGGQEITAGQFNQTFERDLALAEQRLPEGQNVTAALRRQVANAALDQEIAQIALTQELRRLRIASPDEAVRQTVFAMPAFRGPDGAFDQAKLNAALANNGLSQDRFLGMVRGQIAQQQLVSALTGGLAPPAALVDRLYRFAAETRTALVATVPFAAAPPPATPDAAALQRWYVNHPWLYRIPAYRKIKLVALTGASVAATVTVTPAQVAAYYAAHKASYITPEKRALHVIVLHDAKHAAALATQWRGGADWTTMQAAAKQAGGTAVSLDAATAAGLPDPALATAAFAAQQGAVTGPITTALGTDLFEVTAIVPGANQTLAQATPAITKELRADRAANRIYDVVHQVNDVLGTGAGLGKLPGDIGLIAATGMLDAAGNTPEGKPAPLPGPAALRAAILKAAFATAPGEPPAEMHEVALPGGAGTAYFALTVENETKPGVKPFAAVQDQVTSQWTAAQRRKEAERIATRVLTAVQGGETFPHAAAVASLAVQPTPPLQRQGPTGGVPDLLRQVLFGLKPGAPTMVQTKTGFLVAVLDKITPADPAAHPHQLAALRQVLTQSMAQDVAAGFAAALRVRAAPYVDHAQLDSFVNNGQ